MTKFTTPPETSELRSGVASSSIGDVVAIGSGRALTRILLPQRDGSAAETDIGRDDAAIAPILTELQEYFAGDRKQFSLDLAPGGSVFQQLVWEALCEIPYGSTNTYGQMATRIGNPKASRAVGMANNRNPIAIVIPCHRVIGSNGTLVGYAGGLPQKQTLLDLEAKVTEGSTPGVQTDR